MPKSMKNLIVLAKQHAVAGADPVPTPGANAILARGVVPQPINGEFVERKLLRGYKGNFGKLLAGQYRSVEFEVELAGAGAAGTAPKWGPLLVGCDFQQTVNAGVSVVYAPVLNVSLGIALYIYVDGTLYTLLDAKGDVTFELNARQIPVAKFTFMGTYSAPTEPGNAAGMDYTGFVKPITVGKVNTPTFTMHGYSPVAEQISIALNNALKFRDLIGASGPFAPDRGPELRALIEKPAVTTANFAELARVGTTGAVQLIHGTAAGNIIQFDAPQGRVGALPTMSDQDEIAFLNVTESLEPVAGNDELTVTVK